MKSSRVLTAVASLVALAALAGCGDSTPTVRQAKLENAISKGLLKEVGQEPDDISCPGDLRGEVGETMRCTLTAADDELGVTVKVTKVKGTKVRYVFEVDEMDSTTSPSPSDQASS